MEDGTYASYGPTDSGRKFGGRLNLNSKDFSSPTLRQRLAEAGRDGWSVPNNSPRAVVSHELGHGMHLDLCAKSSGLEYGKVPELSKYNDAVRQYIDNDHADTIVEQACMERGVEFDSDEFAEQLTGYGSGDYGEALAEAVAEVRNNPNPRPMARAIYRNLMNYRSK